MPQLQGVGNVPHLFIAALSSDSVLESWRAVSNYEGESLAEFSRLVEELLLEWSGGNALALETRGGVPGSLLNAIEEFLGLEYQSSVSGTASANVENVDLANEVLAAWQSFSSAIVLRLMLQMPQFNADAFITYDVATDRFVGNWEPFVEQLEALYTSADLRADDKQALIELFTAIHTTVLSSGDATGFEPLPEWLVFDGGRFYGNAPEGAHGDYAVTVIASDGSAQTSSSFTMHFGPGVFNVAPVAVGDSGFATRGTLPIFIAADELLANDYDEDGDALLIEAAAGAAHGTVMINDDGEIVYVADAGYVGADSFYYNVSDGQETATARVHIEVGKAYDTVFFGTRSDDELKGEKHGENYIFGGEGDDYLKGGKINDTLLGGEGADVLNGHKGDDEIFGGDDNDIIFGGKGDDVISGDAGDDVLIGNQGMDVLAGGTGDDLLFGGGGADTFIFRTGDGFDRIQDFGGHKNDTDIVQLDLALVDSFEEVISYARQTEDGTLLEFGQGDSLLLEDVDLASLERDGFTFL